MPECRHCHRNPGPRTAPIKKVTTGTNTLNVLEFITREFRTSPQSEQPNADTAPSAVTTCRCYDSPSDNPYRLARLIAYGVALKLQTVTDATENKGLLRTSTV